MQISEIYEIYKQYPRISTDTRKIEANSLFMALKGENFNGNAFAEQALDAGAAYAVIDEPAFKKDDRYIVVDNVLATLQNLASYHRDQLNIPVIGITGTNGKTTTKELIHAVLAEKYRTFATVGNLNNHIGVPLSLLSIDFETEVAVIEMGANHPGEIAFLCKIAKPLYGLITNVGKAHLEGFGDFEGVKRTKAELYAWLAECGGTVFLQQDNVELLKMASGHMFKEIISYGFNSTNAISGKLIANNPFLSLEWCWRNAEVATVKTNLTGAYNTENLLAAIAMGCYFGLSKEEINRGISYYHPRNNRSQIQVTERNTVISDYYNANASSMKAALENLQSLDTELKKMAILGDMFELGDESHSEHKRLVETASALRDIDCIFIGSAFFLHKREDALFFNTTDEAIEYLEKNPIDKHLILLKASRGMAFERVLSLL